MSERSPGMCAKHQLPLDERGSCQLCRLSGMPSGAPPSKRSRWIGIVLTLFVLLGAGAFGFAMFSKVERIEPERGVRPRGASITSSGVVLREPEARSAVPLPPPPPIELRANVAPPPIEPVTGAPAREVSPEDAQRAFDRVRIVMYTTTWCGSCRRAREYLDFNGIPYTEHDIDEDAAAKERLAKINPRTSIPTFQIDDIVQIGFSADNLERRINQAVGARLRSGYR
ncbi:MAG: glutaredoxin family protein [Myxococcota bacterium]